MMSIRKILVSGLAPTCLAALCVPSLTGCAGPTAQAAPEAADDRRMVAAQMRLNPRMMLSGRLEAVESTPILVPSSAAGNQLKAFEELFALFS